MNRTDEFRTLMQELEHPPAALDTTVERAAEKNRKSKRKLRFFGIPVGSLAACFTLFMLLVNLFPPFAHACGRVPALKALAQAVAWSPSLSAAVENEYVQPIEESHRAEGITATVHYVIVDRKQVNIFYSLDYDEKQYQNLDISYNFGELEGWCGTTGSGLLEPGKLNRIDLSFIETEVPGEIELKLMPFVTEITEDNQTMQLISDVPEEYQSRQVTEFCFHLEFDPNYTEQGTTISVNREFELDGQTFTMTEAELYPTHLRINLEDAEENTAWLKNLDLYLENKQGEQFHKSLNGITASGDPDGGGMATFWLDSPYFRDSEQLTLYIKRAAWKGKEMPRVQVDLKNNTCTNLPENTKFGGAVRESNGWSVKFIHPYEGENTMYSGFTGAYWDEAGNQHQITSHSATFGYFDAKTNQIVGEDTHFTESYSISEYDGAFLYLEADHDWETEFDPPVSITIK